MLVRALESSYTQGRRTQYGGRSLRNGSPRVRLSRVVLHRGGHAWNRGRPGGRVRGSFLPCADEVGLGGAATFVAAASRRHRTHELTGREVTRRNIVAVAKPGSMGTGTKRWAFALASRLRCGATSRPTSRRSRQRPLRRSRSCEGETSLHDLLSSERMTFARTYISNISPRLCGSRLRQRASMTPERIGWEAGRSHAALTVELDRRRVFVDPRGHQSKLARAVVHRGGRAAREGGSFRLALVVTAGGEPHVTEHANNVLGAASFISASCAGTATLDGFAHCNFVFLKTERSVEVARDVVAGSGVKGDASQSAPSCLFLGEDHRCLAVATAAVGLVYVDVVHDQGRLIVVATLDQPQVAHWLAVDLDHEHGVSSRPTSVDLRDSFRPSLIRRHPVVADQLLSVLLPQ